MTNLEKLQSMSKEEFADWLDKHGEFDGSPWMDWFDKKYCKDCPAETVYVEAFKHSTDCSYCELNNECKFFPGKETPDNKEIIRLWLDVGAKNEKE